MTDGLATFILENRQPHYSRDLLEYLEHCKGLENPETEFPDLPRNRPGLTYRLSSELKRTVVSSFTIHYFPPSFLSAFYGLRHPFGSQKLRRGIPA